MLRTTVQEALKEILQPGVERLAAISAKSTQISSAAFFMLVHIGRMYLPDDEKSHIDEIAAESRQLGIEYLKLKNQDVDAFSQRGVQRMSDEE